MTRLEEAAAQAFLDLEAERVQGALIGGIAVSVRTVLRTTRDLDVAIRVAGDPEAESLVHKLRRRGYELYDLIEHQPTGRLATARLLQPGEQSRAPVDLLFCSSGIEPEIVASAEPLVVFPGTVVPVARAGHLLALKLLSEDPDRRPQDRMDILALVERASDADLALAREAILLIRERGFHRDRDLGAALDRVLAQA